MSAKDEEVITDDYGFKREASFLKAENAFKNVVVREVGGKNPYEVGAAFAIRLKEALEDLFNTEEISIQEMIRFKKGFVQGLGYKKK